MEVPHTVHQACHELLLGGLRLSNHNAGNVTGYWHWQQGKQLLRLFWRVENLNGLAVLSLGDVLVRYYYLGAAADLRLLGGNWAVDLHQRWG